MEHKKKHVNSRVIKSILLLTPNLADFTRILADAQYTRGLLPWGVQKHFPELRLQTVNIHFLAVANLKIINAFLIRF